MVINGKQIASKMLEDMRPRIEGQLCLAAILVGSDRGLEKFVDLKRKAADKVGVGFKLFHLDVSANQGDLEKIILNLNDDSAVGGIFVELPLPAKFNIQKILDLIDIKKDVDLLSTEAKNKFRNGDFSILPPTANAIKTILEEFNVGVSGKKVAIIGRGELVGQPASVWFRKNGNTVFDIDEFTKDPNQFTKQADIIIVGAGKPGILKSDMIKEETIVLDFGYSIVAEKIVGDADPDVKLKAKLITPVPGGVGPIMIASVLENLIKLNG